MGPKFLKSNFSPRTHAPWNQFSREAHASNNCDRSNLSHDPPSFWAAPLVYDLSSDHLILNSADFSVSATELNRNSAKPVRKKCKSRPKFTGLAIKYGLLIHAIHQPTAC